MRYNVLQEQISEEVGKLEARIRALEIQTARDGFYRQ
jgi:hypothetical protein